jgi:hypothetical protein
MGVETKVGASSYKGIDGQTRVACRVGLRGDMSYNVWDMLYNSSVRPNIPQHPPGTLARYANEGRITKSAEEPTSFPPVGT